MDKTAFLKTLEDRGLYLVFIRPRRFGKSLLLSMMETYYDIKKKDDFKRFFECTTIYTQPTAEKSTYLILKFNLSEIDPQIEKIEQSFLDYIKQKARNFIDKYADLLGIETGDDRWWEDIEKKQSIINILSNLFERCKNLGLPVYVIIDEYDNFANTILASLGTSQYQRLTQGKGILRTFFRAMKAGATDSGSSVKRIFITGVSPITLDDITSGFNNAEYIYLEPQFNCLLGFTESETEAILDYYIKEGRIDLPKNELMKIMKKWYDGYRFSVGHKERLYNSNMVWYFINKYINTGGIPRDLSDHNAKIDYDKIKHLVTTDARNLAKEKGLNGNFSKLTTIIENGAIESELVERFSAEKLLDPDNFISLLFYMGLLSIKETVKNEIRLTPPNETIKHLYYEYIMESYRDSNIFSLNLDRFSTLLSEMAYEGKWKPLIEYITGLMRESMSLRDLITGEKSIQAFLNVYLGLSDLYIIHAERELNLGYADIIMEPFLAKYDGIQNSYILEIKYIKKGDASKKDINQTKLNQLITEAKRQLDQYSSDEKMRKTLLKTNIIKIVLVFWGTKLVHKEESDIKGP